MDSLDITSNFIGVNRNLLTAVLGSPHGIGGYLRVYSISGDNSHLEQLLNVELRNPKSNERKLCNIQKTSKAGKKLIIKFSDIEDRNAASLLVGWQMWVPRKNAAVLNPGEYYEADLHNCLVYQGEKKIGRVTNLLDVGSNQLIEVTDQLGDSFFIPFMEKFVPYVDVANGLIKIVEDYERP